MSRLIECSACGGLIPGTRSRCPHCRRFVSVVSGKVGGIAAAVGIGASLGSGCFVPVADYGAPIFVDAGDLMPSDAGTDAGARAAHPDAAIDTGTGDDAGPDGAGLQGEAAAFQIREDTSH
jgi:hypothetical protein